MVVDKSWTLLERHEKAFYTSLTKFVDDCKPLVNSVVNIKCPCKSCQTVLWVSIENLPKHITRYGWDPGYKTWVHHGEPDLPLPPSVIDNTRQPQMSDMIALLNDLSYIPPNNKQNEPTQEDIGETSNEPTQAKRNEFKELYASANEELYPGCDYVTRLEFMAKFTYFKVKGKCTKPGRCNTQLNGRSWGRTLTTNQSYTMWPVILTTYNLPPWLCTKESSFMLTLLILGPKSPSKDIDVYLRPLIDDLKVLWALKGVETIDIATCQKFNMRAMVLWTINNFHARSSLFGWSRQGYKACPTCNEDTPSLRVLGKTTYVGHRIFLKKPHKWRRSLEFNGEIEEGDPPRKFDRDQIQTQLARLPTRVKSKHPSYGGVKIKRNVLV
ncbi:retrotransposon gag domain, retroviral aspartyl protease [Tanacetum coccineum]